MDDYMVTLSKSYAYINAQTGSLSSELSAFEEKEKFQKCNKIVPTTFEEREKYS